MLEYFSKCTQSNLQDNRDMLYSATNTENKSDDLKFKIVFLGDESVGKTGIINRFVYNTFDSLYKATIGMDFLSRPVYADDKRIRFQLWDTAGQEIFKSLISPYVKDSSVVVICYDITNADTFASVNTWVDNAKDFRGEEVILFIVGNKSDLEGQRAVTKEEGENLAIRIGATFFETSAKSGKNVEKLFDGIAKS